MPKSITEIRSLARSHTRTAINVLVGIMRSKDATVRHGSPTAGVFEPLLAAARYKGAYGGRGSGKLLVWGKLLGLGTTDPLAGFASVTSNLVVSFYFAKRGFENVARIIKR